MIKIQLNGQLKDIPDSLTLADLLAELQVNPQQVAIAKNLEVVVRSQLAETSLNEGDKVEIFHAVGGG